MRENVSHPKKRLSCRSLVTKAFHAYGGHRKGTRTGLATGPGFSGFGRDLDLVGRRS